MLSLETENRDLNSRLSQMNTIEQQEGEQTLIKVSNEVLQSRFERLQIENKRLKEELENSQEQQMQELKSKHDFIKDKYEIMASSGSLVKGFLSQT